MTATATPFPAALSREAASAETRATWTWNAGHLDLERTAVFGPYAQFFAIFGDAATQPGLPLRQLFQKEYAIFRREMAANSGLAVHCRTAEEADAAFRAGKRAAFLSVEGAELLDCDVERLEEAYRLGVRAVNITWNHANILSGSNAEEKERGLSGQGREFVRRIFCPKKLDRRAIYCHNRTSWCGGAEHVCRLSGG